MKVIIDSGAAYKIITGAHCSIKINKHIGTVKTSMKRGGADK
jgi:hypothetical protein